MRLAPFALLLLSAAPAVGQEQHRIDELIRQLGSTDFAAQGAAAKELETAGLKAAPALERARAEGGQAGEWAGRILARLADVQARTLQRLIETLGSSDFEQQGSAAQELAAIGERALGVLKQAQSSDNPQVRDWAARIARRIVGDAPAPTVQGRELPAAVRDACVWLARHQHPAGSWTPSGYRDLCNRIDGFREGGRCDGHGEEDHEVGVTGLALTAMVGAGFGVHAQDEYEGVAVGEAVRRAVRWLVRRQDNEGCLADRSAQKHVYHHAIATLALADASRGASDGKVLPAAEVEALKQAVGRAADFLVQAQNPGQGWRYSIRCGDNDTSVTSWCVQALVSAKRAGAKVPDKAFEGAVAWLQSVTEPAFGRVGYTHKGTGKVFVPGQNETYLHHETLSAAATACRILVDPAAAAGDQAALARALVLRDPPAWDPNAQDFYYWYFGTLHLKLMGGRLPEEWDNAVRKALLDHQVRDNGTCARGSWPPVGRWCGAGGRVYAVSINTLTIETAMGIRQAAD